MRILVLVSVLAAGLAAELAGTAPAGAVVPRPAPISGAVVAAKGSEEVQFLRDSVWRPVEVQQELIAGDTLRTGAIGNLAILFADQTQIRVGRNSTLVVREVVGAGPTRLQLNSGAVWARAQRGGGGVIVETPSAAAAVRGTDWSLAVGPDGQTALVVMEGVVELSNPYGSVSVARGEGATAAVGRAPSKTVIVTPKDREQMLFYFSLRDALIWLPASPLDSPAMRAERARLMAKPEAARTPEDWLTLAEVAYTYDGFAAAAVAARQARAFGLPPAQQARADLIEGLIAGLEQRWTDAVAWLDAALPLLDGRRRMTASWARFFTATLEDPGRSLTPPAGFADDPYAALARGWYTAYAGTIAEGSESLLDAERRLPQAAVLPALRAQAALLLDRNDEAREAAARARALDPDDPIVVLVNGYYKGLIERDLHGALAELERGVAIAPGNPLLWNAIGIVQDERDAEREAEAAFRRAIDVGVSDPVSRSNYAIFLLDQDRVNEASRQVESALARDPALSPALLARGRVQIQKGDPAAARKSFLEASTIDPAMSQGLLALAVSYYQDDDLGRDEKQRGVLQQLDNADRLDPKDPLVPLVRTAIAIDQYEADEAIASARETVKRYQDRGGYYAPIAQNRQAGSYLSSAFQLLELDEWGRFYGDLVFDPFDAVTYFDEALAPRPNAFQNTIPLSFTPLEGPESEIVAADAALSSVIQGLLLDPLAVSSRNSRVDLFRRPFVDSSLTAGIVSREGRLGWLANGDIQGFSNDGIPLSFYANATARETHGPRVNDAEDLQNASLFIGMNLTAYDKLLLFGTFNRADTELPFAQTVFRDPDDRADSLSAQVGIGYSHTFGYRNVLTSAVFANYSKNRQRYTQLLSIPLDPPVSANVLSDDRGEETTVGVAVSHLLGDGPFTFRYGVEASHTSGDSKSTVGYRDFPEIPEVTSKFDSDTTAGRAYLDTTVALSDSLKVEAGAYVNWISDGFDDVARFDPRVGIAWMPFDGQWLRAAYRRDTEFPTSLTLSPVTTVNLLPNTAPFFIGGRSESWILRWDAEWGERFFTAVEYQHQTLEDLSIAVPDLIGTALTVDRARLDRLSASANLWLGDGFGLFGTVAYSSSKNRGGTAREGYDLYFVPDWFARFGVTWVHPSRIKVTLSETLVGERLGNGLNQDLNDYARTDLSVVWEPLDRQLAFGLSILNLFDAEFDLLPAIPANPGFFAVPGVPGPGATILATVTARF